MIKDQFTFSARAEGTHKTLINLLAVTLGADSVPGHDALADLAAGAFHDEGGYAAFAGPGCAPAEVRPVADPARGGPSCNQLARVERPADPVAPSFRLSCVRTFHAV